MGGCALQGNEESTGDLHDGVRSEEIVASVRKSDINKKENGISADERR